MTKQSSVISMLACIPVLFSPVAHAAPSGAYLTDSNGQVVLNSYGECWRTSKWTTEKSGECVANAKAAAPKAPSTAQAAPPAAPVPSPAIVAPVSAPVVEQAEAKPAVESINITGGALFEFDQADIKPEARKQLSNVIGKFKGRQDVVEVVITGRADAIGTDAYNQELSKKRAQSVKAFLLSEGITSKRIVIQALGEEQPVASNNTEEGRAQNRRVDISVQVTAPNK